MRAVPAALGLERAVDTGARPKLLVCAVRAECRALRPLRGGIAGLFHDFTGEEWMRGVDPAVDYRHRSAGAVEAEGPGKIGPDQRDAIPQDRLVDSVRHHALDREVRRFELFERVLWLPGLELGDAKAVAREGVGRGRLDQLLKLAHGVGGPSKP